MRFNIPIIINFLGLLLVINGLCMLLCLPFSFYFKEEITIHLVSAGLVTFFTGGLGWFATRKIQNRNIRKRDGYLIVTFGWIIMSLFGTLPFLLSGAIPSFTDAFFETISGYTTTGATILTDIEAVPKAILFWRSFTHWIGGMGIIVLTIAILPLLGIGGMQLFVAESPGIAPDKLHPRITVTAKRLWMVYVFLTFAEMVLLMIGGMTFFDAINHAMSTLATGGFSTKNASIAYYDSPFIHYVIIVFMFLAGTNFTLSYFMLRGNFSKLYKNEEFKVYAGVCLLIGLFVTLSVFKVSDVTLEKAFRDSLFQVLTIITTTGFITADYTTWAPFITFVFFILFFIGGSAGSTAGGIKIMRHIVMAKNTILELKRQIHPSAVLPVRFNTKAVPQNITFNIMAFILIYLLIFFMGSLFMSLLGLDFESAIGTVIATLGNIGPGLGSVGPVFNFAHIPAIGKWFLSFLMLLGRLELFTVLILFTAYFWRKR